MDLMARRRAIMGMPSGKDYTVSGNVVSISNALAKNAKSAIVTFLPKQSGSGDPSPNNVRPISGYNDISAVRYGKNLYDISSQTSPTTSNTFLILDVKPSTDYVFSVDVMQSGLYVQYDNNGTWTNIKVAYDKTFIAFNSGNHSTIRLMTYRASSASIPTLFQLEYGNTATSYEPYISPVTANVHSDTTIFGGTVDLVSGECVVDRVFETITGNSNWYSFSTGTGNSSAVVQLAHWDNVKYTSGNASYNGAIGSSGREAQNYWTNSRQNEVPNEGDMAFAYSSGGQLRVHRTDVANITDLASFKTAFVDLQICYPLATPITYHLTPSQLAMLKGNNTVYSNEGSISLTYVGK